jgi:hypothetical protein
MANKINNLIVKSPGEARNLVVSSKELHCLITDILIIMFVRG